MVSFIFSKGMTLMSGFYFTTQHCEEFICEALKVEMAALETLFSVK